MTYKGFVYSRAALPMTEEMMGNRILTAVKIIKAVINLQKKKNKLSPCKVKA